MTKKCFNILFISYFSFQLSVELLDYMDDILGLQAASKNSSLSEKVRELLYVPS